MGSISFAPPENGANVRHADLASSAVPSPGMPHRPLIVRNAPLLEEVPQVLPVDGAKGSSERVSVLYRRM